MKTDSPRFRFRLYWGTVSALCLLVILLRTLALCLTMDKDLGYFGNGALTGVLYAITLLGVAACFTLPLLMKPGVLPEKQAPLRAGGSVCACLSALAFIAATVYLFIQIMGHAAGTVLTLPAPAALMLLTALACTVAALYFLLRLLDMDHLATPCAYGVILAGILLLSVTYFDRYTQMNAPHKVWVQLSLLSIMIYTLYELRARIGRPAPRALAVASALLLMLCIPTGVSDLIAYACNLYDDALYLICDLVLTAFAVYVACRTITTLRSDLPNCEKQNTEDAE